MKRKVQEGVDLGFMGEDSEDGGLGVLGFGISRGLGHGLLLFRVS